MPSAVLTVIVAVPLAFGVTLPFESTVATFVLLDDHVTFLFDAVDGDTVAVNVLVSPICIVALVGLVVTPVTLVVTVTLAVPETQEPPISWHTSTLIVVVPLAFPVITPDEFIVAIFVFVLVYVICGLLASSGNIVIPVAVVAPTFTEYEGLLKWTFCSVVVTLTVIVLSANVSPVILFTAYT